MGKTQTGYGGIKIMNNLIAVDFDGVIHKFSKGWQDGSLYDEIMPDAYKEIKYLQQKGYEIVVFTTRDNLDDVRIWLKNHNLDLEVTNKKPNARAFIDDRAIRFTNWSDVAKYF